MAVSQGGPPGDIPIVLLRFKEVVRVGSITGPYDGLYYWKITARDDVDAVGAMLWRHLSRGSVSSSRLPRFACSVRCQVHSMAPAVVTLKRHGQPGCSMAKVLSAPIGNRT